MRKTVWTLNVGNYAPELCELTYPLLLAYARKIGADFQIINERRFPEMPVTYEKLQIFYLGRGNDWNVYIDSDAVIFPDMFDITERLTKDTVAHYNRDHCSNRFKMNDYFRRDGRHIGSANWFTVASDWCLDLWNPFPDVPVTRPPVFAAGSGPAIRTSPGMDAIDQICPIVTERQAGITPEHLIDDYTLSLNIARYGLKFTTVAEIMRQSNDQGIYAWHTHRMPVEKKLEQVRAGLGPGGANLLGLEEFDKRNRPLKEWLAMYGISKRDAEIEDVRITQDK